MARLAIPRVLNWGQRGTVGVAIPQSLEMRGVAATVGDVDILRNVTLSVSAGEVVALLGPSGCGKTTLLRILAGVERLSAGQVLLDGRAIASQQVFVEPEARGIGFVFQDYALFPHLTLLQNVMFGLRRQNADVARETAMRALSRVGLAALADQWPDRLSGGEQQRVALARAIAPRPGVILMDEPFSNLDRRMRDTIREETVSILRELKTTALIVTHDPEEAMRVADRIALMRAGEVVQAGQAFDLYQKPRDAFTARFFCDFNEITGVVRAGRVETPLGNFPAPGLAEGTTACAFVRPQAIKIVPAGFCLPARVIEKRFLGEVTLVDLAMPGLERPIRARVRLGVNDKLFGDVGIDIAGDEVLVFQAEPA